MNAAGAAKAYGRVEDSLTNQQNFVNALNGANGIGNQSSVFDQLQGVASGQGPNPAQAMLAQSTGQNVAQTGALMASSRGASSNPGMIARQAGLAGGNIQQQAAGQGATLQAQQSLGALNQMGGIAGQQVGQQLAGSQGLTAAQQASYGQLLDAIARQNATAAGLQENINTGNTAQGINSANNLNTAGGGILNSAATGFGLLGGKETQTPSQPPPPGMSQTAGTQQMVPGAGMAAGGEVGEPAPAGPRSGLGRSIAMAKGGKVPARVSPGEIYLSPDKAKAVAKGKASPLSGERIKGKAKVKGDSYANDTVNKTLQSGGVVIPRSKANGDDVVNKATAFVQAVMARGGGRG